ncbi:hypothetical protein CL622_06485 [archaeon]|nr:hypothetical protein [archaeon]
MFLYLQSDRKVMVGELILGGGGTEEEALEVNQYVTQDVNKVLYIPLAWKDSDYESCLQWFTPLMSKFNITDIAMVTDTSKDPLLDTFDVVYIGGGNTFKLLKALRGKGLDQKLLSYYKNGGRIAGSSAGSLIFGKSIDTAPICVHADVNTVGLKDTSGLDACQGWDIQAHYVDNQENNHMNYSKGIGRNVIGIPNESAVVVQEKSCKVIGKKSVSLITKEGVKKIDVNGTFSL